MQCPHDEQHDDAMMTQQHNNATMIQPPNYDVTAVLYPPQVIPYGIHGMEGGFQKLKMDSICLVGRFHGISRWIFRVESIWNEFMES